MAGPNRKLDPILCYLQEPNLDCHSKYKLEEKIRKLSHEHIACNKIRSDNNNQMMIISDKLDITKMQ